MTGFTSLGLDLSCTATGVVLLRESGQNIPELIHASEIKPKSKAGMVRVHWIVSEIMEMIHGEKPDRIVVEGYSLGKNASSTIPLVELGGLLRFMLYLDGLTWFDPRASEVKKFATGKGNAQKDVVMMHVLKRWAYESATNNIADAYVLACMGLAQANRLPGITKEMRAIAGQLTKRMN